MLNLLPRISGFFIACHLEVSYSVAVELANIALLNGLKLSREVSNQPKASGIESLLIRDGGLRIQVERLHDCVDIWISEDGDASDVLRNIADMREPIRKIRTKVSEYRGPRKSRWAVVPSDQYSFTKFL